MNPIKICTICNSVNHFSSLICLHESPDKKVCGGRLKIVNPKDLILE